ncbi:MAG: c-type cytochrome [Paucibacter sp.]|nr:c-type cytochrome [Roseateles sp.]
MIRTRFLAPLTAFALVSAVTGCANLERSRDVSNPAVPGAVLAQQVCANCHGAGGSAASPNFPNLASQTGPYLVSQLKYFRSHDRSDPPGYEYMWGLTRSLTDSQIDGLAAYFSASPLGRQPVEGEAGQIAAGKRVFEQGVAANDVPACASCHGSGGLGNSIFPRLAGQHMDYLVKQLQVFQRTEQRSNPTTMPTGEIMKNVAHKLDERQIVEVAAYAQSIGN